MRSVHRSNYSCSRIDMPIVYSSVELVLYFAQGRQSTYAMKGPSVSMLIAVSVWPVALYRRIRSTIAGGLGDQLCAPRTFRQRLLLPETSALVQQ